jgi:putative methionine-R-sulfoxide reductase with GAF domain
MEYIAIHKKDKVIGVIDLDEITIEFLDRMFQEGYEFMRLSKKDLVE